MPAYNEDISRNPNYTTKSKINRKMLRQMKIPDFVSVKQAKEDFDSCHGEIHKVGMPYDKNKQRHTKFVSKFELYRKIIKGR